MPCIKAARVMNRSPKECFELFKNDERVGEYNDNCVELEDIARLQYGGGVGGGNEVKVNWCATGKYGVFGPRDFTTVVRNEETEDGGYLSVATAIDMEGYKGLGRREGYVRSRIVLSASFMKPVEGEDGKCEFWQLTKVGELGGVANTRIAKKIQSKLLERAPIDFLERFGKAVVKKK
ncbi:hypothetical protein TrCOL_g4095 [Triparma columacea]|uniref:START domain-containing protein n=1 Tax=Triparma columacea TaxID=722753 RepID=A0A9W7FZC6_9STRA|nr:hypothetical protein TrCOL_g4095 [Triparma columacea]